MKEDFNSLLLNEVWSMQIFNLQIAKNDLARREIRKYRVIWPYWQPNQIDLYILKENNLQNINPNCETNPPSIFLQ